MQSFNRRPAPPWLNYNRPIQDLLGGKLDKKLVALKVEKSRYQITVLYRNKPIKTYPAVFGRNPIGDKLQAGDNCTPEGSFQISALRSHPQWSKFLALNYPTADSWRKFKRARARGKIPAAARIGGDLGIHGVPAGYDAAIEAHQNWTQGCISLKTHDIQELYTVCRAGTRVQIVH